jgi:hypothetical protein
MGLGVDNQPITTPHFREGSSQSQLIEIHLAWQHHAVGIVAVHVGGGALQNQSMTFATQRRRRNAALPAPPSNAAKSSAAASASRFISDASPITPGGKKD